MNTAAVTVYAELASETPVAEHPAFEQKAAYVEGLLTGDERRMIEDHLASCAQCAPQVADLRAFRNQIAPEINHEFQPGHSVPGAKSPRTPAQSGRTLPAPLLKIPIWIYAVAPALLLLALAAWVAWKSTTTNTEQVAVSSPTPAPTVAPVLVPTLAPSPSDSQIAADIEKWPFEYQRLARAALTSQRVETSPHLEGLSRPASSLMGGDDPGKHFAVTEPAGRIILTDRPTFRWSSLSGATGYVVEVYDEKFRSVISSPVLTGVSWTSPPLTRGELFSWQVKAIKEGQEFLAPRPPAPQAKFRILDQVKAAEISRVRRDYSSSHLLLGLVYARAGLLEEAEQELSALQKANPDDAVVRKLTASVRSLRR